MTLTFLIGTGIRYAITWAVQGVRAAKDFNNPDGPQVRYNKKGKVKKNGAVYNLVTRGLNANKRRKGGEAGDHHAATQEDDDNSSTHPGDLEPQTHQSQGYATQSKPSEPRERPDLSHYVSLGNEGANTRTDGQNSQLPPPSYNYNEVTGPSHQQHYSPAPSSTPYTHSVAAPAEVNGQYYRQGPVHSSPSSSAASWRDRQQFRDPSRESPMPLPAVPVGMSKSDYKKERKDMKRQYKATRDEQKAMGGMTGLHLGDSPSSSRQPQSYPALQGKDDLKKSKKELKKQYKSARDEQKAMRKGR